jgi:hypothetical protein
LCDREGGNHDFMGLFHQPKRRWRTGERRMKALILSVVAANVLNAGFTRADEETPPNILFILADDMG